LYDGTGCGPSMLEPGRPLFRRSKVSMEKLLKGANKRIERSQNFLNKLKLRRVACANRAKAIPENATVRKEYIRCKKINCYHEQHGPYYYAYWKDPETKKLNKKYIGIHMPENKKVE
jgi:hypothetical protein